MIESNLINTRRDKKGSALEKTKKKTLSGTNARTAMQTKLRSQMEGNAAQVIELMTHAITKGILNGKEIAMGQRLDLMKSYLPYVLPQLKSVEHVEKQSKDLQPLIINMHKGSATITTTDDGATKVDIDTAAATVNKDDLKATEVSRGMDISHDSVIYDTPDPDEIPQVILTQSEENGGVAIETPGDIMAILNEQAHQPLHKKKKS